MKYKFTTRKPSKPYIKKGVGLQFWEEDESLRETEEQVQEDGTICVVVTALYYDKYHLAWREEFSQGSEYDEEGNMVRDSYINENHDDLLTEAKEQI